MSKFSKAMRATNAVASLLIAIGVAVDLYEKFKGRKKTPAPVLTVGESPTTKKENRVSDSLVGHLGLEPRTSRL